MRCDRHGPPHPNPREARCRRPDAARRPAGCRGAHHHRREARRQVRPGSAAAGANGVLVVFKAEWVERLLIWGAPPTMRFAEWQAREAMESTAVCAKTPVAG